MSSLLSSSGIGVERLDLRLLTGHAFLLVLGDGPEHPVVVPGHDLLEAGDVGCLLYTSTEEGVTFVCGVDASEGAVAKRLLAEYDAVILCCGAGAPRPLGLDTTGISGVCYGTEYLKAAVERAQDVYKRQALEFV